MLVRPVRTDRRESFGGCLRHFLCRILNVSSNFTSSFEAFSEVHSGAFQPPLRQSLQFLQLSLLGVQLTGSVAGSVASSRFWLPKYSRLRLVCKRPIHPDRIESVVHFLAQHVHDINARVRDIGLVFAAAVAWSVAGSCRKGTSGGTAATIRGWCVGQFWRGHSPRDGVIVGWRLGRHGDGEGLVGSISGGVTRDMGRHFESR